jgi:uncharacterized protein YgiM (DUF1202 family)
MKKNQTGFVYHKNTEQLNDETNGETMEGKPEEKTESTIPKPDGYIEHERKKERATVTACLNLNVRKEPKPDAEVVLTIPCNTEVRVDIYESAYQFYKICTASGIEGFCMKQFITIK